MKLYLHAIIWWKFAYSLFLANIPIACEQFIIGTPCYQVIGLCDIAGWYEPCSFIWRTWDLFSKIKIQIACSSMIWQFLPEPYLVYQAQNLHIYATYFCIEFCQVLLTLIEEIIIPPRSRSRTRQIYKLLLHWEYAKTCFRPPKTLLLH